MTVGQGRLDEYQRRFVESEDTDIRLLAPAGSGKTHSLLWRCTHLSRQHGGRARFLVVTFTRAARDELRARLFTPDFKEISSAVDIVTLNGWGFRQLRHVFQSPRLHANEIDRNRLVQNTLQPAWINNADIAGAFENQPYKFPKTLITIFDTLKSLGFDHEDGSMRHANDRIDALGELGLMSHVREIIDQLREYDILPDGRVETFIEVVLPVWIQSCGLQRAQTCFTLDDQKYFAFLDQRQRLNDGLQPEPDQRISHVMVDEFQDINPLDLNLVDVIAKLNGSKLTIVGDDDQAIFEWRGATPEFILHPDRHFGRPFSTFILERNYRCPKNLVSMSSALIAHNKNREPKVMTAFRDDDADIMIHNKINFIASVNSVMEEVRHFLAADPRGAKLAILSRKRAQLIPYQIIMARENLPFCAAEDLHVFLSETFDRLTRALGIRHMAGLGVRLPTMTDDVVSLCDSVLRFPLSRAVKSAVTRHILSTRPSSYEEALDALETYPGKFRQKDEPGKMSPKFANAIRQLVRAPTVRHAIDTLQTSFDGFGQDYGKSQEDIFRADPPFLYLAEFAEAYGDDFQRFIDDLELAKHQLVRLPGEDDEKAADDLWKRPVHLMTALRAKGKEFDTVVMLDVVDGIWPLRRAQSERALEAERRLFYVAMTRAKRSLVLTLSGRIGDQPANPSPYLTEALFTY